MHFITSSAWQEIVVDARPPVLPPPPPRFNTLAEVDGFPRPPSCRRSACSFGCFKRAAVCRSECVCVCVCVSEPLASTCRFPTHIMLPAGGTPGPSPPLPGGWAGALAQRHGGFGVWVLECSGVSLPHLCVLGRYSFVLPHARRSRRFGPSVRVSVAALDSPKQGGGRQGAQTPVIQREKEVTQSSINKQNHGCCWSAAGRTPRRALQAEAADADDHLRTPPRLHADDQLQTLLWPCQCADDHLQAPLRLQRLPW
jgi:hypothetical protein